MNDFHAKFFSSALSLLIALNHSKFTVCHVIARLSLRASRRCKLGIQNQAIYHHSIQILAYCGENITRIWWSSFILYLKLSFRITLYAQGDKGNSSLIVFCFYVDQPNDTCGMISSYYIIMYWDTLYASYTWHKCSSWCQHVRLSGGVPPNEEKTRSWEYLLPFINSYTYAGCIYQVKKTKN